MVKATIAAEAIRIGKLNQVGYWPPKNRPPIQAPIYAPKAKMLPWATFKIRSTPKIKVMPAEIKNNQEANPIPSNRIITAVSISTLLANLSKGIGKKDYPGREELS
jgi:hypothetical protein